MDCGRLFGGKLTNNWEEVIFIVHIYNFFPAAFSLLEAAPYIVSFKPWKNLFWRAVHVSKVPFISPRLCTTKKKNLFRFALQTNWLKNFSSTPVHLRIFCWCFLFTLSFLLLYMHFIFMWIKLEWCASLLLELCALYDDIKKCSQLLSFSIHFAQLQLFFLANLQDVNNLKGFFFKLVAYCLVWVERWVCLGFVWLTGVGMLVFEEVHVLFDGYCWVLGDCSFKMSII